MGKYDKKAADYINSFWATVHRPPAIREIQRACGIPSSGTVRNVLDRLVLSGEFNYSSQKFGVGKIVPAWVAKAIDNATPPGLPAVGDVQPRVQKCDCGKDALHTVVLTAGEEQTPYNYTLCEQCYQSEQSLYAIR